MEIRPPLPTCPVIRHRTPGPASLSDECTRHLPARFILIPETASRPRVTSITMEDASPRRIPTTALAIFYQPPTQMVVYLAPIMMHWIDQSPRLSRTAEL